MATAMSRDPEALTATVRRPAGNGGFTSFCCRASPRPASLYTPRSSCVPSTVDGRRTTPPTTLVVVVGLLLLLLPMRWTVAMRRVAPS